MCQYIAITLKTNYNTLFRINYSEKTDRRKAINKMVKGVEYF